MTQSPLVWHRLAFANLSSSQLYEILRVRQEVFVLEQHCIYLDADGKDCNSLHVFATCDEAIVAYCRVLPPALKYTEASIGRVLSVASVRGSGAGRALVQHALAACEEHFPGAGVRISAQLYLEAFYESFGFVSCTAPYQEDGIPHIEMLKP